MQHTTNVPIAGAPTDSIVQKRATRHRQLGVDDYVNGVLSGNRAILARAITLVESNAEHHQEMAQQMIARLLPHSGKAIRVGITGVPGAGKSSLIETLGCRLCAAGHQLAVLAVDPSSSLSGGSILGDKTRMELLSRHAHAFIRPSPSSGVLGGVARKSRETMIVCEAAGYDVIIVETVGVGQSEITVRSMVDIFLLLQIAGAGDELQGIKKGVMERCDLIVVNKADGDNKRRAETARADYQRIVRYLQPSTEGWQTQALACSATTGEGVDRLWAAVEAFSENTRASGVYDRRRQRQNLDWMHNLIAEQLKRDFYNHAKVRLNLPAIEEKIVSGTLSPTHAAQLLQDLGKKRWPASDLERIVNREAVQGQAEARKESSVLHAVRSPGLADESGSEADELRVLQEVSDWLEDSIGEASEHRDLAALLRHTRDRALLLLLFWRRIGVDELVSLHVEDMEIGRLQGLTSNVVGTRGRRQINWRPVSVPALEHLCPVSAVRLWLSVSGLGSGPLFPRITRCGDLADDGLEASGIFPLLLGLVARSQRDDGAQTRDEHRNAEYPGAVRQATPHPSTPTKVMP